MIYRNSRRHRGRFCALRAPGSPRRRYAAPRDDALPSFLRPEASGRSRAFAREALDQGPECLRVRQSLEAVDGRGRRPGQLSRGEDFDEGPKPAMLVQHRRPDVDDAERIEAQEDPVLAQGAEEMRVGRGPLAELGLALGHGETAGRYGNGERISAGAALLTPSANRATARCVMSAV